MSMNPLTLLYHEVLFRPLLNLLVGITNVLPGHAIGWSIIVVTLIVRLILLPFSLHHARQMQRNQEKMSGMQEKLRAIKKKHKQDPSKQAEETMRLYREVGLNPASGCLPLLIQLPILIALYRVFLIGLSPETFQYLYGFIAQPTHINFTFASIDLTTPSLVLGIIAGAAQFIQMKWLSPQPAAAPMPGGSEDTAAMMSSMQRNMMYIFPVMTVFISLQLPAALALYWAISTLFGMGQQYAIKRTMHLQANPPAI